MSKSRGRNGLLGVGGQRKSIPRRALRGRVEPEAGGGTDPRAQKEELLRKMRERSAKRANEQE